MTKHEAMFLLAKRTQDNLVKNLLAAKSKEDAMKFKKLLGNDSFRELQKQLSSLRKLCFFSIKDLTNDLIYHISSGGHFGAVMWVENHLDLSNEYEIKEGYKR